MLVDLPLLAFQPSIIGPGLFLEKGFLFNAAVTADAVGVFQGGHSDVTAVHASLGAFFQV